MILSSDKGRVRLPRSSPWSAPEVTDTEITFSVEEAKRADIYSFALLCLWILFKDVPQLDDILDSLGLSANVMEYHNPLWVQKLKEGKKLREFVIMAITQSDGLDQDEKEGLGSFFNWALIDNPSERVKDPARMEDLRNSRLQQIVLEDNRIATPVIEAIDGLEWLYVDIQELLQPIGYSVYVIPYPLRVDLYLT